MPRNHSPVVVGVDGTDRAVDAACWAAAVARKLNAPLHIVHARPYSGHNYSDTLAAIRAAEVSAMQEAGSSVLDAAVGIVGAAHPDVEIVCAEVSEPVDAALVDLSRHARLVVLGADEISLAGAVLVGSTTVAVASHSACPVVAWRGDVVAATDRPIVLGVGSDQGSQVAAAAAFELAERLGVGITAVRGWSTRRPPGEVLIPQLIDWDAVAAEELQRLREVVAPFAGLYPGVDVSCTVHRAKPSSALLRHAGDAQLMVVGSRGRGLVTGALLGSTGLNLLHHCRIPTMICHSEGIEDD